MPTSTAAPGWVRYIGDKHADRCSVGHRATGVDHSASAWRLVGDCGAAPPLPGWQQPALRRYRWCCSRHHRLAIRQQDPWPSLHRGNGQRSRRRAAQSRASRRSGRHWGHRSVRRVLQGTRRGSRRTTLSYYLALAWRIESPSSPIQPLRV